MMRPDGKPTTLFKSLPEKWQREAKPDRVMQSWFDDLPVDCVFEASDFFRTRGTKLTLMRTFESFFDSTAVFVYFRANLFVDSFVVVLVLRYICDHLPSIYGFWGFTISFLARLRPMCRVRAFSSNKIFQLSRGAPTDIIPLYIIPWHFLLLFSCSVY